MTGSDIRALLSQGDFFQGLPDAALEKVLEAASPVMVPTRAVLFHQGDRAEHLYFVVKGLMKMWQVGGSGTPSTIRITEPGGIVGCIAVLRRVAYPATATAIVDGILLSWPAAWVLEALERYPAMRANSLDLIGRRTEELVQRLHEMATERVDQRIARALLRLGAQTGRMVEGGGTQIGYPLSRQDIAEIVGTDLYVVSRALRRWAAQGVVAADRLRVVLLDPVRLLRIADGAA